MTAITSTSGPETLSFPRAKKLDPVFVAMARSMAADCLESLKTKTANRQVVAQRLEVLRIAAATLVGAEDLTDGTGDVVMHLCTLNEGGVSLLYTGNKVTDKMPEIDGIMLSSDPDSVPVEFAGVKTRDVLGVLNEIYTRVDRRPDSAHGAPDSMGVAAA